MARAVLVALLVLLALVPQTGALPTIRATELTIEGPDAALVGSTVTFEGTFRARYGGADLSATRVELLVDGAGAGTTRAVRGDWSIARAFPVRGVFEIAAVAEEDLPQEARSVARVLRVGTPPGAPAWVAGSAVAGALQVRVTWDAPADDGGVPVSSYRVLRQTNGAGWITLGTLGENVRSFLDASVAPGATYRYAVAAVNALGGSPLAEAVVAGDPPSAPTLTVAPIDGSDRARIDVAPNGGTTQRLDVQRSVDGGASWQAAGFVAGSGGTILDPVRFDLPMPTYRAFARSVVGDSGPASGVLVGSAAPAPELTLTMIENASRVRLALASGGPATQAYEIERSADGGASWSRVAILVGATTHEDIFSVASPKPVYRAFARNLVGDSPPVAALVVGTAPGATTNLRVEITDVVRLRWDRPTDGGTVQGYFVMNGSAPIVMLGLAFSEVTISPAGPLALTVHAVNYVGSGAPSNVVHVSPPAAPAFTATPMASTDRVRLDAHAGDENARTIDIQRSTDGIVWTTIATGSAPALVTEQVVDLVARPTFRAIARGPTGPSSPTAATIVGSPPGAPTDLVLVKSSPMRLQWAHATGVVQAYEVRNHGALVARVGPTSTSLTVSPGVGAYAYTVRALSYAGDGPLSASLEGAFSLPSAPVVSAVVHEGHSTGTVDLSWTVASNGGAPFTSFEIWRTPGPWGGRAKIATLPGSATELRGDTIGADRTYTYEVIAKTGVGQSTGFKDVRLSLDWNVTGRVDVFRVCEGSVCTDVPHGGTYERAGTGSITWSAIVTGHVSRKNVSQVGESVLVSGYPTYDEHLADSNVTTTDASGRFVSALGPWPLTPASCDLVELRGYSRAAGFSSPTFASAFTLCP